MTLQRYTLNLKVIEGHLFIKDFLTLLKPGFIFLWTTFGFMEDYYGLVLILFGPKLSRYFQKLFEQMYL